MILQVYSEILVHAHMNGFDKVEHLRRKQEQKRDSRSEMRSVR